MNKPDKMTGPIRPRRTAVALAAAGLVSTRALTRLAGVLGLVLLFDPAALAQTTAPILPVRASTGLLNGVQAPVTNGSAMTITQNNQRAIIDWQSFNIGLGSTVTVTQPAATSILLNRVVAGSATNGPSTINGALQANGRIFILDPNGVVLGSTAQVNVGGLLAAAMTMTSNDSDFVGGIGALSLARGTNGQGAVQVDSGAQIAGGNDGVTTPTGDVVLLGVNNVDFNGHIVASNVFIGAGGGAQVPVGDSGFVKLSLLPAASTGANFVAPTVTAGAFGVIDAKDGSVTIATSGDGETPVTWASAIDATGGSINFSGASLTGSAVDILSQSDTSVPIPVPLTASTITISGRSDVGTGVSLANVNVTGDNIVVRGVAAPAGVAVPQSNGLPTVGVDVTAVQVKLGAPGTLLVAGRADAADAGSVGAAFGLRLNGLSVTTPDAGGTRVTLAGQGLNGATNAGIVTNNGGASGMFSLSGVQMPSGANVEIGASATQNGQAFQSVLPTGGQPGLPSAPFIRTTGKVNLRPLGVDLNGNVVEQPTQSIQIESDPQLFTTSFVLPANWIADLTFDSGGNIQASGMVIGSAQHQGRISLGANALGFDTLLLTLQNQGAASAGVGLQGNVSTARELTILSAGPVDQTAALRVNRLQLQGDSSTTVTLTNAGNEIDSLGFDRVGKLDLVSHHLVSAAPIALSLDTGPLSGYDADLDVFTGFTPAANSATSSVSIRADVLTLNSSVAMSGAGSTMDLVASAAFSSPGSAALSAGPGGVWRVWAPNWVTQLGSLNGTSPTPTMFGCVFGDTSTCSVSQVALPASRSGLFFSQQPTLTITPTSVSGPRGRPLPALPFDVTGLVAGNSAGEAIAGALATTATPTSPAGSYPIQQGSLSSPLGYRLALSSNQTTGAVPQFTLTPAVDLPRAPLDVSMSQLLSSTSSDTYGRNLAVPSMCLAPGAARRDRAVADGVDLLGLEWGRVRLQPQLSSCVEIATEQSCSAF